MPEAACHCGAVRIVVPAKPEFLVDCNCSICKRNAALWAFYESDSIELSGHPENITAYVWGSRTIRTMFCKVCGCATHWEPIGPEAGTRIGVNARNLELSEIEGIEVRRFDGADTWTYLDGE
jgi:hypothetical protein